MTPALATIPMAGEFAALATAVIWSFSALAWAQAGKHVSAMAVVCLRTLLAVILLAGIHLVCLGNPWQADMDRQRMLLLAASGFLGAGVGDMFTFHSLVRIGPRLGMLLLNLSPILAALVGYLWLGEGLSPRSIIGMLLTVGAVIWVVTERRGGTTAGTSPQKKTTSEAAVPHKAAFARGVIEGAIGAGFVAFGFVLSRKGLAGAEPRISGLSAALVRVSAAGIFLWPAAVVSGYFRPALAAVANRKAMKFIVAGTFIGPVFGIWMSMLAFQNASAGVATTLVSTTPVMMIPIVWLLFGERPSLRAVLGSIVAVVGVALLVW